MAQSSTHFLCRGATVPITIVMTVLCLFLAHTVTHAVTHVRRPITYIVGGEFGWDTIIPMDTWAQGKTFYAGDILEFKYDYQITNMVVVNQTGYETCIANKGAIEYNSGDDKIHLPYGYSYYIGNYTPEDCQAGEKMAIKALAPK